MHGLVVVDKNQKVLRPAIIWCDSRAVEIGKASRKERTVWSIIEKVILATGEDITLEDMTEEVLVRRTNRLKGDMPPSVARTYMWCRDSAFTRYSAGACMVTW